MKKQLTLMFAIIIIATSVKAQIAESDIINMLNDPSETSFDDELIGYWRLTSTSINSVYTDYEKNVITFENMDHLLALDKTGEVKKELDNYKKENDGKLKISYMVFLEDGTLHYYQNGNKWTGTFKTVYERGVNLHISVGEFQKIYNMCSIDLIKNKTKLEYWEGLGLWKFTKMNDKEIEKFKEIKFKENNETADKLIAEAQIQLNSGNTIEYKKLLERAVQIDPNNVKLVYNLGVIAYEAKNFLIARNYYEKAIKLDPNYADAFNNIAIIILKEDNNIITEINSLGSTKADDDRFEVLNNQRFLIFRSAIPYLEKVIQINKNSRPTINTLMNIYKALGEDKEYERLKKM